MDRNHLINGKFLHNLNGWTPTTGATYSAGDGDTHYGVAVLPEGESITQSFAVTGSRVFSLSISMHSTGGTINDDKVTFTITDGSGLEVLTDEIHATDGHWTTNTYSIGLAEGTSYSLEISNNTATSDVHIDDVWLWFVPITRAQIAAAVHVKLGRIATERSLTTAADGDLTEGSYTYAVDAGLRTIGAVDPDDGIVSIRYVDIESVQTLIEAVRREMLERLQADYAIEVDTSTGPYRQNLSQKAATIKEMVGGGSTGGGSGGSVVMRKISYD